LIWFESETRVDAERMYMLKSVFLKRIVPLLSIIDIIMFSIIKIIDAVEEASHD
jgi:hypothetical protein